ncbi:unnamed protein product [Miscanthus lutarioriparius]|uniref:Uncharacterized protein n=1 Tax=Miscanthus lutarioriparius TaxID=422564 RepID=A0A811Q655_9POAL|nr:unnamed protein product [Miscanthus lutarioriparius]
MTGGTQPPDANAGNSKQRHPIGGDFARTISVDLAVAANWTANWRKKPGRSRERNCCFEYMLAQIRKLAPLPLYFVSRSGTGGAVLLLKAGMKRQRPMRKSIYVSS